MHDPFGNRDVQHLTVSELTERARGLVKPGQRSVLGITGPPGAGKSTLAEALQDALGPTAIVVPMDGFHRSKAELAELGRLDRMGAPDTFDARSFVDLVRRLRDSPGQVLLAPKFDRGVEAPIPDAIHVSPDHRLVIVDGNYLLLDYEPWLALPELLDEIWYVDLNDAARHDRLIARHVAYGKAPDAARAWSLGPDETNARLIASTRGRADLFVSVSQR